MYLTLTRRVYTHLVHKAGYGHSVLGSQGRLKIFSLILLKNVPIRH